MGASGDADIQRLTAVLAELREAELLSRARVVRVGAVSIELEAHPPLVPTSDAPMLSREDIETEIQDRANALAESLLERRVAEALADAFGASQ